MEVKILQKGGKKNHHFLIEEAVRFFANELMSTRMSNILTIRVALRVTGRATKDIEGHVDIWRNGSGVQRLFNINIDRDAHPVDQIRVLAHEMIHVQQVVSKRLQARMWKSDRKVHVRWEGEDLGEGLKIPYREQPWEVEAFENQGKLSSKFFDFLESRMLKSA